MPEEDHNRIFSMDPNLVASELNMNLQNSAENHRQESKAKTAVALANYQSQVAGTQVLQAQAVAMMDQITDSIVERNRQRDEQQKDLRAAIMKIAEVVSGKMQAGEDMYTVMAGTVMNRIINSDDFQQVVKKLVLDTMAGETVAVNVSLVADVAAMAADIKAILAFLTTNLPENKTV